MGDLVKIERPHEGVALLTLSDTAPQHNLTCKGVSQLADALEEARKGGARVSVLASGVPGHWFEHAYLDDIYNLVGGRPATGDPAGWFRSLTEVSRQSVVTSRQFRAIPQAAGRSSAGAATCEWRSGACVSVNRKSLSVAARGSAAPAA